jgi:hypothetical protein
VFSNLSDFSLIHSLSCIYHHTSNSLVSILCLISIPFTEPLISELRSSAVAPCRRHAGPHAVTTAEGSRLQRSGFPHFYPLSSITVRSRTVEVPCRGSSGDGSSTLLGAVEASCRGSSGDGVVALRGAGAAPTTATSHREGQEQLRRWRQPMARSYGGVGVGRRPSRAPATTALGSRGGSTPERRWSSPADGHGGDGPRRRMVAVEAALGSGAVGALADGHGGTARRTAWRHGGARAPHWASTGLMVKQAHERPLKNAPIPVFLLDNSPPVRVYIKRCRAHVPLSHT